MTVLTRVAESGGFAEAARQLDMSPPAVTRAVAALEERLGARLGARLLVRSTRSVKLTEAGERFLDDCRRILAELAKAEACASGSYAEPMGILTISAPALFGRMHVLPILTEFLERYPKVVGRAMFVDRMTNPGRGRHRCRGPDRPLA
jgi:DNA-binding transcriptional LysR family regulator